MHLRCRPVHYAIALVLELAEMIERRLEAGAKVTEIRSPSGEPPEFARTSQMPAFSGISPADIEELAAARPGEFSKQERDFAFAALLIRHGHVTDRQLQRELRTWTTFGSLTLQAFLREKSLFREEIIASIEAEIDRYLAQVEAQAPRAAVSCAQRTAGILERLDPDGGVAKVFGLSTLPKPVRGHESRLYRSSFRLVRKLGQGGLGAVWLAVDTSLNRLVAVKEILPAKAHWPTAMARFRREAEITGRLDHPSIVPVHLLGEDETEGRLFYVMRFLGNETLNDAIWTYHERRESGHAQPLEFHRLLTAFVSICQAIAYAHSKRVIHRDLKPQNIALADFGQVIVLDWGLARVLGQQDLPPSLGAAESATLGPHSLDVTFAGQVMGTPMYMAPEQAAGRIDDTDERTDVYGLGAILFAILTGAAPHEHSAQSLGSAKSMSKLLDIIVNRNPTRPRKLVSKIDRQLEAICLKALARERYARYPSAIALSEDVQRWMTGQPVSALRDSTFRQLKRWVAEHRRLAQALAVFTVVMMSLLVSIAVVTDQRRRIATQVRHQQVVDAAGNVGKRLEAAFNQLAANIRFASALPAVQGIVEARRTQDQKADELWTSQLELIARGLLDANPSYTAITFWTDKEAAPGRTIRVESDELQRGLIRTDLTAFFNRHFPAIDELRRGDIYLGIPGRLGPLAGKQPAAENPLRDEPVGLAFIAGAAAWDKSGKNRIGGMALECNLEAVLSEQVDFRSGRLVSIDITDAAGTRVMRFTREARLVPLGPQTQQPTDAVRAFFADPAAAGVFVVTPARCAVKVRLSPHDPTQVMGLIAQFDE